MSKPLFIVSLLFYLLDASRRALVAAQLALPSPPWLPPPASMGAVPSSSNAYNNSDSNISANPQWSTLLGDLLYFYEAQRSGKLPSTNRVTWRNDSALQDGTDVGLDLSGGYYDAGDYIKCTYPLSFVVTSICWGATDFGKGYDLANQTAYLDDMLRWSLDWLMKAHPDNNSLYVQVGNADLDNAYWGGDQNIPDPRPSYQINNTFPGTDAAASASAAFSACSMLYSSPDPTIVSSSYPGRASLQNQSYADILLSYAQSLYTLAANATGGLATYQTSVPAAGIAYASSSYGDDLSLAALLLSQASNSSDLYVEAQRWYAQFELAGQDVVLNWDEKGPAVPVLMAQIASAGTGPGAGNLSGWQAASEAYFDRIVNGTGRGQLTEGGLLYYAGDSTDASLNPSLNAAMLMMRYAPIASNANKTASYKSFAQNQLNYALGDNPMSVPYVVGVNPNSPSNPHSALASGGTNISLIDTSPLTEAYVIYGAVIGGPDQSDNFWDIRSDWPETEAALDYAAPLLTLAAMNTSMGAAWAEKDPFYTQLQAGAYDAVKPKGTPCDDAFPCASGLSSGAKAAIGVVVTLVGLGLIGLAAWWFVLLRRKREHDEQGILQLPMRNATE